MIRTRMKDETKHKLCASCSFCMRIVLVGGRESVTCQWGQSRRITEPVESCTGYDYRYACPPGDMTRVAWVLDVNKKGQVIGFRPPEKDDSSGRVGHLTRSS